MSVRPIRSAASLALLAGASFAQGTLFPVSHPYPSGPGTYGSALADVNADGKLDYAVVHYFTNTATLMLGTGTGTFNPQPLLTVGDLPRSLVFADLNGDTRPDLVVVNSADFVSVLLGNGAGGFGAATPFPTLPGGFPTCIDAGDVNNDGKLDIVVGNQATNDLSVLFGNGLGGLGAPVTHFVGFSAERLELAHMNADAFLDCVTSSWLDETVAININDGSGNLLAGTNVFSFYPKGLAVGDVNADGKPDVVTCGSDTDTFTVFRGNGTGGLLAGQTYWLGTTSVYPTSVIITDAGNDGLPDVITFCTSVPSLILFNGTGGGDFALAHRSPVAEGGYDAVAGDLNGDGFPDVVTSNMTSQNVRSHISAGVGSWEKYCTPKVNSLGCTPRVYATGTPSVSNVRPFWVYVFDVLDNKPGLFLYTVNGTQAAIPFQGGTLCVGPTAIRRTPAVNSGTNPKVPPPNCEGAYVINFNAFAQGLVGGNPAAGLLVLGNTYQLQAWSRDPGFPAPNNSGLSPALDVTPWQ